MLYFAALFFICFQQNPSLDSGPAAVQESAIPKLKLVKYLPVDDAGRAQLSGLTLFEGKLLTVSDKNDDWIFEIKIQGQKARLVPFLEMCHQDASHGDLEGLTTGLNGDLYVISERKNRVMKISTVDGSTGWVSPPLTDLGQPFGLLMSRNAGLEGLAFLPPDLMVVAAERQDRGLLSWQIQGSPGSNRSAVLQKDLVILNCDRSRFFNERGRNLDFAGLFFYDGKLVALQRNNHLVTVVTGFREGKFIEGATWSYSHVENDPLIRYADREYGLGEGICLDKDFIYIVMDHNHDHRECDPEDLRPTLLVFQKPKGL